jgi:catechol 2,3-dioxygenase-like lactoylglutathione lyase family enzyme
MNVASSNALRHSHFGVAVSDIEKSTRFYRDALGFEVAEQYQIAEGLDAIMELEGVELRLQFMRRPDTTLELICYDAPDAFGPRERRPLNQYGLTHMSFWGVSRRRRCRRRDRARRHAGDGLRELHGVLH